MLESAKVDRIGASDDIDGAFNFSIPSVEDKELDSWEIRTYFICFMVVILNDYRDFLIPPSKGSVSKGDLKSLFQDKLFCEYGRDDTSEIDSYKGLVGTQMFADFVFRRASSTSADYSSIMFFDSCIDTYKKALASLEDPEDLPMFDWHFPTKRRRGSVTIPKIKHLRRPLKVGLKDNTKFSYKSWPVLDDKYFNDEESFIGDIKRAPSSHVSANSSSPLETLRSEARLDMLLVRTEQERRESLLFEKNPEDHSNLWAEHLYRHFIGCWLICAPALVSFGKVSPRYQFPCSTATYLFHSLQGQIKSEDSNC